MLCAGRERPAENFERVKEDTALRNSVSALEHKIRLLSQTVEASSLQVEKQKQVISELATRQTKQNELLSHQISKRIDDMQLVLNDQAQSLRTNGSCASPQQGPPPVVEPAPPAHQTAPEQQSCNSGLTKELMESCSRIVEEERGYQDRTKAKFQSMQLEISSCLADLTLLKPQIQSLMEAESERARVKNTTCNDAFVDPAPLEVRAQVPEKDERESVESKALGSANQDANYHVPEQNHNPKPLPKEHSKDLVDDVCDEYVFNTSIWDASLFIGTEAVGKTSSTYLLLLLFVNIVSQLVYTILIDSEFRTSSFEQEKLDGFREFRARVAHDIKWQDGITRGSLASRLCGGDPSLELASTQALDLEVIDDYIPRDGSEKIFGTRTGYLMCILALIVWCLVVEKEVRNVCNMLIALMKRMLDVGTSRRTILIIDDGKWVLRKLCLFRVSLTVLLGSTRLFLVGWLLMSGLEYLVYTISLQDLVLNAVALECIIQLDELIFEALAPQHMSTFIENVEPLPLPKCLAWHGVDVQAIIGFLFVSVVLGITVPTLLNKEVDRLKDARSALCDGSKDFVYTVTEMAPFFQWAPSNPHWDTLRDLSASGAVLDVVYGRDTADVPALGRLPESRGSSLSVLSMSTMSMDETTYKFNAACRDLYSPESSNSQMYRALNQALLFRFFRNVTSCNDPGIVRVCDLDNFQGTIARSMCPQACGCHRPDSLLVMSAPSGGCPLTCFAQAEYSAVLDQKTCVDTPWSELQTNPIWTYFANQVQVIARNARWPDYGQYVADLVHDEMLSGQGCGAIALIRAGPSGLDLCDESDRRGFPFRSLRLFCPAYCKCKSFMKNCPSSCPDY